MPWCWLGSSTAAAFGAARGCFYHGEGIATALLHPPAPLWH